MKKISIFLQRLLKLYYTCFYLPLKNCLLQLTTLKTHAHLDLEVKLNKSTIKPWMDVSVFAAWLQDNLSHYNIKNAFKYVYSHPLTL
jgi:hypothetical protein